MASSQQAQVIDLGVVRAACTPLLRRYERFLSEGRVDIGELDKALAGLRALTPMGGRLGRAIALLAEGDGGRSTEEVLGALELLRQTPRSARRGAAAASTHLGGHCPTGCRDSTESQVRFVA